jgi:hypothetical protein
LGGDLGGRDFRPRRDLGGGDLRGDLGGQGRSKHTASQGQEPISPRAGVDDGEPGNLSKPTERGGSGGRELGRSGKNSFLHGQNKVCTKYLTRIIVL